MPDRKVSVCSERERERATSPVLELSLVLPYIRAEPRRVKRESRIT